LPSQKTGTRRRRRALRTGTVIGYQRSRRMDEMVILVMSARPARRRTIPVGLV
jgi:hypothetical protein